MPGVRASAPHEPVASSGEVDAARPPLQTLDMIPKQRVQEESNESAQRAFEKLNLGSSEVLPP